MLPTDILKWATKYDIDHTIVWEIVETVTNAGDDLNYIEDETHLFDLTVQWAEAMTQSASEDPTREHLQSFLFYDLPVVYALAPHLESAQRVRLLDACASDTPVMADAMHIALGRIASSPKPPAAHS